MRRRFLFIRKGNFYDMEYFCHLRKMLSHWTSDDKWFSLEFRRICKDIDDEFLKTIPKSIIMNELFKLAVSITKVIKNSHLLTGIESTSWKRAGKVLSLSREIKREIVMRITCICLNQYLSPSQWMRIQTSLYKQCLVKSKRKAFLLYSGSECDIF